MIDISRYFFGNFRDYGLDLDVGNGLNFFCIALASVVVVHEDLSAINDEGVSGGVTIPVGL